MSITEVPIESIAVDPEKIPVRSLINEEAVQALADKLSGRTAFKIPLVVWRDDGDEVEGERYLLVSGGRRLAAACELEWLKVPVVILEGSLSEARSHAFLELANPGSRGSPWEIAQMVVQIANAEKLDSCRRVARLLDRGKSQVAADMKIGRAFRGASVENVLGKAGLETADLARATKKTLLEVASRPGLTADDRLAQLAELLGRQPAEADSGGASGDSGGEEALACDALPDPEEAVASGAGGTRISDQTLSAADALPNGKRPEIAPEEAGEGTLGAAEDDLCDLVGAMVPLGGPMWRIAKTATPGAPPPGGQAIVVRWGSPVVPRLQGALIPLSRPAALVRAPAGVRVKASTPRPSTSVGPVLLGILLFLLILLAACPGTTTPSELPDPKAVLLEAEGAGQTGTGGRSASHGPSVRMPVTGGMRQRDRARLILPPLHPGSVPPGLSAGLPGKVGR